MWLYPFLTLLIPRIINTLIIEDRDLFDNVVFIFPHDMVLSVHHDYLGLGNKLYVLDLTRVDQHRFPV